MEPKMEEPKQHTPEEMMTEENKRASEERDATFNAGYEKHEQNAAEKIIKDVWRSGRKDVFLRFHFPSGDFVVGRIIGLEDTKVTISRFFEKEEIGTMSFDFKEIAGVDYVPNQYNP